MKKIPHVFSKYSLRAIDEFGLWFASNAIDDRHNLKKRFGNQCISKRKYPQETRCRFYSPIALLIILIEVFTFLQNFTSNTWDIAILNHCRVKI